ncbi:sigma-70 family RNA polymerase sigma factor [Sphingomonas nostoxanthinifaciens]|uniref:sigma-70 family RNA polymerase sigma factor n=1 Tax=Sphingomonas nostoxanthinifaciens TaxID=2872652 RepID=UPI001CC1F991|nr:sigma-70 family RNA polymerase sigma factor [Sphingomonas nostoxanthinifaciens]
MSGRQRDVAGLEAILINDRQRFIRFFKSRTRDAVEAEEVVQEIHLRIQRVPAEPIADPAAYIYRVGLNIVIDRARERSRRRRREEEWSALSISAIGAFAVDGRPSPHMDLEARQRAQQLARAIDALPAGAGRAFRLHKLDGLSHAEVAAEMKISRSGVEKHIAVAFRHLAKALEE